MFLFNITINVHWKIKKLESVSHILGNKLEKKSNHKKQCSKEQFLKSDSHLSKTFALFASLKAL